MVDYIGLLKKEVVPAEGCTEPVAVAFAVSLAAEQLGADATDVRLKLSANIIKNALGVGIPGTGMVGIEIAAALVLWSNSPRSGSRCCRASRLSSWRLQRSW